MENFPTLFLLCQRDSPEMLRQQVLYVRLDILLGKDLMYLPTTSPQLRKTR